MGALPCLAAVLVISLVGVDAGLFRAYTDTLEERECTCNCCIREPRRPNEINGDIKYKCSMPPANDERMVHYGCTNVCTVVNDPIFFASATVETNRFCFYHCQPTAGGMDTPLRAAMASQHTSALYNGGSLVDAECVSIRPNMMDQAVSSDHNGRDAEAPLST
eukprot:CAMPEP_0179098440 /NCGR_PEP_ID=MMETSP0796-20121207/45365_1 /TAXON_ID=73915 /ORGANISM="Pyrodinium bahamense, Strain pbaha01" /LENGTH=162 /DNA_ID=CAMNT_0020796219 /DNA_START=110 /DNA_END=598 /DNA_ORIENTATION=-